MRGKLRGKLRVGLVLGLVMAMVTTVFTAIPVNATRPLGGPVDGEASLAMIYIRPDGSVDPETAPIERDDDEYELTDNIYGHVVIQKSGITLDGEGYTLEGSGGGVLGSGGGFGVHLQSVSNVIVENLIVKRFEQGIELENSDHNTIQENIATECSTNGIRLSASSNNIVMENEAYSNSWDGIVLREAGGTGSSDNLITRNKAYDNYVVGIRNRDFKSERNSIIENTVYGQMGGIDIYRGGWYSIVEKNLAYQNSNDGISVWGASYSLVTGNTLRENGKSGLFIRAGFYSTYEQNMILDNNIGIGFRRGATGHNLIQHNWIQGSEIGVKIFDLARNNNVITMNTITQNDIGATLDATTSDNRLHHNNFIRNGVQAEDYGSNIWDDGAGEGNYWSDYEGEDLDDDGVGDTDLPHQGVDWYPLMSPSSLDPVDAIVGLKAYVEGLDIPHGIKNSLISQLNAAENALLKGQENAAVNILNAFIHHVEALRDAGKLTQQEAEHMISSAQIIIEMIVGG